mmetsp:Transcript_10386/g.28934  ORF Transcript_10386/g.28934 Transcript_10386/m.28934 type:complete len:210 (+) Transcript_10386:255-884(+)
MKSIDEPQCTKNPQHAEETQITQIMQETKVGRECLVSDRGNNKNCVEHVPRPLIPKHKLCLVRDNPDDQLDNKEAGEAVSQHDYPTVCLCSGKHSISSLRMIPQSELHGAVQLDANKNDVQCYRQAHGDLKRMAVDKFTCGTRVESCNRIVFPRSGPIRPDLVRKHLTRHSVRRLDCALPVPIGARTTHFLSVRIVNRKIPCFTCQGGR